MSPRDIDPDQIARAAEGSSRDIEELLRHLESELRAQLSIPTLWRRSLDADDVLQVSFMEAFLRFSALRERTPAGLRAWMRRMVQNNLADAIRGLERDKRPDQRRRITQGANGRSARTLLGLVAGEDPTPGSVVSQKEQVQHLHAAISKLPASYRQVVQGADLEERPVAELAEELGRSPGAVHLLRSRAHERLCELLRDSSV